MYNMRFPCTETVWIKLYLIGGDNVSNSHVEWNSYHTLGRCNIYTAEKVEIRVIGVANSHGSALATPGNAMKMETLELFSKNKATHSFCF